MLFFKVCALYLTDRWLDSLRLGSVYFVGAVVCCLLGFYDKLNFVWFIIALSVSTTIVYGRALYQHLRDTSKLNVDGYPWDSYRTGCRRLLGTFKAQWSPSTERLVTYLNSQVDDVDAIYCVDWGIWQQAVSLGSPRMRDKLKDSWPAFSQWNPHTADAPETARQFFSDRSRALYISFGATNSVFPACYRHFAEMNAVAGVPAHPDRTLPDQLRDVYEVFEKVAPRPE